MLPEVKTVLYASDLQSSCQPAFRMAVRQAQSNNARLVFMTVVEGGADTVRRQMHNSLPESLLKEIEQENLNHMQAEMIQLLGRFVDDEITQGVEFPEGKPSLRVAFDVHPDRAIINIAEELDADLIVLGTRRRHGLDHWLTGSVSRKVQKGCRKPILMVPLGA